jgi:hypothetical protein
MLLNEIIPIVECKDWSYKEHLGGNQLIVNFNNGYGASIVKNRLSYGSSEGLYELTVLWGDCICYTSGITEDVLGYLTPELVIGYLVEIKNLPPVALNP